MTLDNSTFDRLLLTYQVPINMFYITESMQNNFFLQNVPGCPSTSIITKVSSNLMKSTLEC